MARFHRRMQVGSVRFSCGTDCVSTAKSGLSRTRLAVLLRWGTETPERVPASLSYTRRLLIVRQKRTSMRQGNNNKQTNTLSARYFLATAKASFIEENVAQKFAVLLGRHLLLIFVHCACSSFSSDLLAGFTVSFCFEDKMLT